MKTNRSGWWQIIAMICFTILTLSSCAEEPRILPVTPPSVLPSHTPTPTPTVQPTTRPTPKPQIRVSYQCGMTERGAVIRNDFVLEGHTELVCESAPFGIEAYTPGGGHIKLEEINFQINPPETRNTCFENPEFLFCTVKVPITFTVAPPP